MTYELAKKLKDAGFKVPVGASELWQPNLSELIEACGDNFGVLERFRSNSFGAYIPNDCGTNGLGKTPEEAVANLWLEVNWLEVNKK